jgi:hypothetical protein
MARAFWMSVLVVGGVVLGPGNPGLVSAQTSEIRSCVSRSATGQVRIIGPSESCKNNEDLKVWNLAGPTGPKGDKGDTGEEGPQGVVGTGSGAEGDRYVYGDRRRGD